MKKNRQTWMHFGLLLLRLGLGGTFLLVHGLPKLTGGEETWIQVGSAMEVFGIQTYHAFWGFLAAISEGIGGLLLIPGLLVRPVAIFLTVTMFVATMSHIGAGDTMGVVSRPIEMAVVFLALFFLGPGKYSLDWKLELFVKKPKDETEETEKEEEEKNW